MDTVWLDVSGTMPLSGNFHPFTEIECDPPEPLPSESGGWQRWASGQLATVAEYESWQPGRYAYSVATRDDAGRPVETFAHGQWELSLPEQGERLGGTAT